MRAQPQHQVGRLVAGEIVPHQQQPQRRQVVRQREGQSSDPPATPPRPLCVAAASCDGPVGGQLGQDRAQVLAQPRVQHRIGAAGGWLQPHLAGGGMEQGQDLGCAAADVFVRLEWPVGRAAATTHQNAARPGTGRPRPRTRPRAQAAPPACRPAQSAFFGHRIGIADAHHTGLALAHHHAGFAPGAALLPAQAARMQGAPDRERADPGQSVMEPGARLSAAGSTTKSPCRPARAGACGPIRPGCAAAHQRHSGSVVRPHGRAARRRARRG